MTFDSGQLEKYKTIVIIELPDVRSGEGLTPEEIRLELACALYARGPIGKVAATEMAGVDFFAFQRALGERGVPLYTQQMLTSDILSLNESLPK